MGSQCHVLERCAECTFVLGGTPTRRWSCLLVVPVTQNASQVEDKLLPSIVAANTAFVVVHCGLLRFLGRNMALTEDGDSRFTATSIIIAIIDMAEKMAKWPQNETAKCKMTCKMIRMGFDFERERYYIFYDLIISEAESSICFGGQGRSTSSFLLNEGSLFSPTPLGTTLGNASGV